MSRIKQTTLIPRQIFAISKNNSDHTVTHYTPPSWFEPPTPQENFFGLHGVCNLNVKAFPLEQIASFITVTAYKYSICI